LIKHARLVEKVGLALLPMALVLWCAISVADASATQRYFVSTTYYLLLAAVLCWVGTYVHAGRDATRASVVAWLKENWPGILIALAVTVTAAWAIEPALRMLSDEANLIGTSKNLFASKTATFTISGKNYYDSYWDIDVSIDRRPTLFPFLVSLIHALVGYSYRNAFVLNLLLLPAFLLVGYRLAKSLGGETFGIVAALLAAAHPITLLTVRSGGFDFLAAFLGLLVIKSLNDFSRQQEPAKLALVWLNLLLFAEVRYEAVLFIPVVVAVLLLFKMLSWDRLRPYAFVYALSPAFLLPRVWQSILRGSIPEQDPGTITFSLDNFLKNAAEYFRPLWSPSESYPAHFTLLIAAGVLGSVMWLRWLVARARARAWTLPGLRFGVFVAAWIGAQAVISFTYFWGQAHYPSAARLLIALDTFFSFAAAWVVTIALQRWPRFVPMLVAAALLITQLPIASQHRFLNRLTQTRESATTWRFFERLGEKRILIVTDRPNHFTIMDYGAMSFDAARRDPYIFTAFARHLFYDIYVIQQLELSTGMPRPGYELWPNRKLEPVLEFQNDANVLVRVSRLAH
jgi:hypothetical protein